MIKTILPIVEGHSEEGAVPVLLRRLLPQLGRPEIQVARPFRVSRLKMVRPGEIERAIVQGIRDRRDVAAVLVILDADDDDPLGLEASLLERCRTASPLPSAVVAACREFEAWFLGSKDSLRGVCGIRPDANAPDSPESIRDAKGRLTSNMAGSRRYLEVADQPVFAARMDLDLALRRCLSFQRLATKLERILAASS
ncbi:MAG TPA: DUF4276 family protein [Thermoanaerobaculia bacterium]|nr:DUF4276 family protein [Thermoanaerobaculia bacterium]